MAIAPEPSSPWSRSQRWMLIVVLSLPALLYLPTLRFDFVYDDNFLLLSDPTITAPKSWLQPFHERMWDFAGKETVPYYRPLTILFFAVEHRLFGENPLNWHLVNVLLHVLTTLLVFWVGERFLRNRNAALIAALLFGVYPIGSEVATWVAAANESLEAIAILLCFGAFLQSHQSRWRGAWIAFSVLMLVYALLIKEVALVFPVLIFFVEWRNPDADESHARLPRPLSAVLVTLPYVTATVAVLALRHSVVRQSLVVGSVLERVSYLGNVVSFAAFKLLWPVRFSAFYPTPDPSFLLSGFWIAALLVIFLLCWRSYRATFFFLWIALTVLPAINIGDPLILLQTRYLYLAGIAVCWCIGWSLTLVGPAALRIALTAALFVFYAGCSFLNARHWSDNVTLFGHAVEVAPQNQRALLFYANALGAAGRDEEALAVIRRTEAIAPTEWRYRFQESGYLLKLHRIADAEASVAEALKYAPPPPSPQYTATVNLKAQILLTKGDLPEAERYLRSALAADPGNEELRKDLASCLRRQGRAQEAAQFESPR